MRKRRVNPDLLWFIALLWVTFAIAYGIGAASAIKGTWPYSHIVEIWRYVAGHPEEHSTLAQKILNDTGVLPLRYTVSTAERAHPDSDYDELQGLPITDQRLAPLVYLSNDAPRGHRLIYGAFDFDDTLHGAILLDADGKVQNTWQITQNDLSWDHRPDHLIFPHGLEVTRDGSLIVAYTNGSSLTKYDYCGQKQWQLQGSFHHTIDLLDQDSFWVLGNTATDMSFGHELMQISVADGAVLRRFEIQQVLEANPDIDILGIRQIDSSTDFSWTYDPFHTNDIDPLPEELAHLYPDFEIGDVIVSLRSLNLIFVLDPSSLKIKWWRQGLARRQHDPDWNDRGTITIFNNNMHLGNSTIVEVDPRTMEHRTLIDGDDYDFYAWRRGNHQELPGGDILIVSSEQGRVFEVAPDGNVTFDFHNFYDSEDTALAISEAVFLDEGYFQNLPQCSD